MIPEKFGSLLRHCAKTKGFRHGISIHAAAIKASTQAQTFIGNHILNCYAKCEHTSFARKGLVPDRFTSAVLLGSPVFDLSVEESKKVFRSIVEKDAISWNTFVAACSRCEDNINALGVFREMLKDHNVRPDNFTHASVLSSVADLASIRHGKEIHARLPSFSSVFNVHEVVRDLVSKGESQMETDIHKSETRAKVRSPIDVQAVEAIEYQTSSNNYLRILDVGQHCVDLASPLITTRFANIVASLTLYKNRMNGFQGSVDFLDNLVVSPSNSIHPSSKSGVAKSQFKFERSDCTSESPK
ncbi:hypothetical protein BUALT_Bualt09G0057300 [Buddleja alternifolia]|uniref:Pentatricopeptide repeat-containing protein n=1 Tax=Buddleja alternifolia TaxID=168488 RepID=A0AAV6X099_9LAMI|nr:hypothetical protein BUALT_Bualt09G0057300 [Buddleja alternifolia]